jgi:hypothetical protein
MTGRRSRHHTAAVAAALGALLAAGAAAQLTPSQFSLALFRTAACAGTPLRTVTDETATCLPGGGTAQGLGLAAGVAAGVVECAPDGRSAVLLPFLDATCANVTDPGPLEVNTTLCIPTGPLFAGGAAYAMVTCPTPPPPKQVSAAAARGRERGRCRVLARRHPTPAPPPPSPSNVTHPVPLQVSMTIFTGTSACAATMSPSSSSSSRALTFMENSCLSLSPALGLVVLCGVAAPFDPALVLLFANGACPTNAVGAEPPAELLINTTGAVGTCAALPPTGAGAPPRSIALTCGALAGGPSTSPLPSALPPSVAPSPSPSPGAPPSASSSLAPSAAAAPPTTASASPSRASAPPPPPAATIGGDAAATATAGASPAAHGDTSAAFDVTVAGTVLLAGLAAGAAGVRGQ